jgi:hypothetical protein
VYVHSKAIRQGIHLFETQTGRSYYVCFPWCEGLKLENKRSFTTDSFPNIIRDLKTECQDLVGEPDKQSREISFFKNALHFSFNDALPKLQIELII